MSLQVLTCLRLLLSNRRYIGLGVYYWKARTIVTQNDTRQDRNKNKSKIGNTNDDGTTNPVALKATVAMHATKFGVDR